MIVEWEKHRGVLLDKVKGFDVIECKECGYKHIIPIPGQEELDKVYREEYYSQEKPLYLERHCEDLEWWNLVYDERYDTFEKLLKDNRRRILDIGSGPGFFLLRGKERGWNTLGIEPSVQAADHSRKLGLEITNEFLNNKTVSQLGTFDVVHMSEVLEHIPNPKEMLELAHRLLNPGGLVCIIVPNDYNPIQKILTSTCGYNPWWVAPPHHINYFDFNSLSRLLKKVGFEPVYQEATFPIDIFLLMGDNYIGNDELGRQCHKKRKQLELNVDRADQSLVKREIYRILADIGIGREIFFIAKCL
ncbi:MAG: class I SAM-dependent methyltransferase [Syntrophomonas sp.]